MEHIDDYILAFFKNSITEEELQYLKSWTQASAGNHEYFRQMCVISKGVLQIENGCGFDPQKAYSQLVLAYKPTPRHRKKRPSLLIVAASILLFLVSGFLAGRRFDNKAQRYTIEVPSGSKSKITLPDGSIVWLNAGSKLTYDSKFALQSRHIGLEGEGYFDVAVKKDQPFVVHTADLSVTALGTRFDVKAYPGEGTVKVSLETGAVKVSNDSLNLAPIYLSPQQQAIYTKNIESFSINNISSEGIGKWSENIIYFDDIRLREITLELERKYSKSIYIMDSSLDSLSYFSSFDENQNLLEVLDILSEGGRFSYKIKQGAVYLYK